MSDGELRIAAGAATTLAGIHRRAATALDEASSGRPSGDLGEGGDEIEAIMRELSNAAGRISATHSGTAERLESTTRRIGDIDDQVGAGFDRGHTP